MTVTIDLDVPAAMRDGVVLRANVYRPGGDGPWPTLLARLPYGKDDVEELRWLDPLRAVRAGFMVVIQDTRGRWASDGEWAPFRHERDDGYDSVEWAARLTGSNGRVAMYGGSYLAHTQWAAATAQPPSLVAIAPGFSWCEPLDGWFARGGALEHGLALAGALRVAGVRDEIERLPSDGYWQLPAQERALLRRRSVPDVLALDDREAQAACRVAGQHHRVTVPSLHVAGWFDSFLQGTLDNYAAMAASARLIVGPWVHDTPPGAELADAQVAWLRGDDEQPPVRIFVMGRNAWRDEDAWPLRRARMQQWFLGGDGALGRERGDGEPTCFAYDPADPVPTVGGNTLLGAAFPPGPADQTAIEARPDVCTFTSPPLAADLEVTGRVRVVLHAASSAPSTDWVARLCDVHPDGRSYNVCDGIVRLQDRASACQRVEVDLWSTSMLFRAGHRLRVDVTSSSFPRWDRNLNTGRQDQTAMAIARQQVFHDAERASWIELPVISD